MTPSTWLVIAALGVAVTVGASRPATDASAPANKLDADAAALAGKVLTDPLDTAARDRLAQLRKTQRERDAAAYRALAQGLQAYLEAGPELAEPALAKAAASPRASSLTRSLATPLSKIVAELHAGGGATKICRKCGNTGWIDCTAFRCYGSGYVSCPDCKGTGIVMVPGPALKPQRRAYCRKCAGSGIIRCEQCEGTGKVRCPDCKTVPGAGAAERGMSRTEAQAVRQVICKARRLARGEVDLYTAGALAPSPK